MISDVLSEAVETIDGYLNEKTFDKVYQGELRKEIVDLRNRMEAIRIKLDTPAKSDRDAQKGEPNEDKESI